MKRALLFAVGTALFAIGCDKTYTITFSVLNVPGGQAQVTVQSDKPLKSGSGSLGMIESGTSKSTKIVIDETQLPATIFYNVGTASGSIQLTKETNDKAPIIKVINFESGSNNATGGNPPPSGGTTVIVNPR